MDTHITNRLFLGVKINLNEFNLLKISEIRRHFETDKFAWTHEEDFHITLLFIGQTNSAIFDIIDEPLQDAAFDIKKFNININRLGIFEDYKNPKVLWIGTDKSS